MSHTRNNLVLGGLACLAAAAAVGGFLVTGEPGRPVLDVYPGESIQAALEAGADSRIKPIIRIHAGVYRPPAANEALVFFNARHDGIIVEGVGNVTLTAANPAVADPHAPSYPAVVNHVVYFGDGISPATVLRGVTLTGANQFVQAPPGFRPVEAAVDLERADRFLTTTPSPIETNAALHKTHYFYSDGGAILVYGRSYPTIENVEIADNRTSPCGAGVSIQHHLARFAGAASFRHCRFRSNRAAVSGSALDVLSAGSSVVVENCLFTDNVSSDALPAPLVPRFGAMTVMPDCCATVTHCTFTNNSAGVDDRGQSRYEQTIFWRNDRPAAGTTRPAFDLNIARPDDVTGCWFTSRASDMHGNVSRVANCFDAPDPQFDADYRPHHRAYADSGYRP